MATQRGRENQQPVLIHPNATTLILAPAGVSDTLSRPEPLPFHCASCVGFQVFQVARRKWSSYSYRTRCVEAEFCRLVP